MQHASNIDLKRSGLPGLCLWAALTAATAAAQVSVPKVSITPSQVTTTELARTVLVQPAQLEARLNPGMSTTTLTFTLLSPITTEVYLKSQDRRLIVRLPDAPVRLTAHMTQPVSVLVMEPHAGQLSVLNRSGDVIGTVPYRVKSAKLVNQNLSLNYSPGGARLGLNYSVSGVPASIFDPRWSASANVSLKTDSGQLGGGVSVNLSW